MSDILQPGLSMDQAHPDADQLTAFTEHTLPPHEQQQTLAHLATCADCRQVVFLAQQAVEIEETVPEPDRPRKPWFFGWNLLWPTALALTGIVWLSVHLRTIANSPKPFDTVTTARVEPPSPSVAPEPAAMNKPKLTPAPLKPAAHDQRESLKEKAAAPPLKPGATADLPIAKATTQPVRISEPKAGVATAPVGSITRSPASVALGTSNSVRLRSVAPAQQAPTRQVVQSDRLAQVQAAPQPAPRLSTASPPLPSPAPPVAAANETVTVDASTSVEVSTANSALQAEVSPDVPLPSSLRAESKVTVGTVTLALDLQGNLFRSTDRGRHWKRIKPSWHGHVTMVRAEQSAYPNLFVLRMDDGSVWSSTDGQHWRQTK